MSRETESELLRAKAELRTRARARRKELATTAGAAGALLRHLESDPPPARSAVAAYVAMGDEIDPTPLVAALLARGHIILLPRLDGRDRPLALHRWRPGEPLVAGQFGLEEPTPEAPRMDPDVLFVPLLAFDRRGHRLGYGAGYYDRTLRALRARRTIRAIGLAFAGQEVAEVPVHQDDEPLDAVLTEAGWIRPGGARGTG